MNELINQLLVTDFFTTDARNIIVDEKNYQENEYMYHILYDDKNSTNVINSLMVLRGVYRDSSKLPGYAMVTTEDAIVKYDIDAEKIIVTLSASNDKEGAVIEFDDTCGEDEFFQQSLITDLRGVTFDFIKFVRDAVKIVEQHELAHAE